MPARDLLRTDVEMKVRWVRFWSGVALVAILSTLAALFYLWGSAVFWGDRLEAGEWVPEGALRRLPDESRTAREKRLIGFVDCDCPTCSELMEKLYRHSRDLTQEALGGSIVLIGRRPCEPLTSLDPPFRIVIDADGEIFRAFEIWQVPSVFVLDRQGRIVENAMGWNADEVVWRHIQSGGEQ